MTQTPTRPNILLIMADQWRADHLGALGNGKCATPHLDRIAQRGCLFTRAVTPNPVCQPARAALLTGRYPHQINLAAMNGDLRPDIATVPQALRRAGYATAIIGKLHFIHGTRPGKAEYPRAREGQKRLGFDHIWEAAGKELLARHYCDYAAALEQAGLHGAYLEHLGRAKTGGYLPGTPLEERWPALHWPLPEEFYVDNMIGARAVEHLRGQPHDRPFFLQVSFCGPHPPYDPPLSLLEATPEEAVDDFVTEEPLTDREKRALWANRRRYRAMIACIDGWIGRLLDTLEERGQAGTTLIAFCSDHGEMLGDHRLYNKMVPFREATRIPMILAWPGAPGARRHDGMAELTDLSATLLDAAGLDPRAALTTPGLSFHGRIPGRSLRGIATGEDPRPVRDSAFSGSSGMWNMVETPRWKLVRHTVDAVGAAPREELFDLESDPGELADRAGDPACRETLLDLRERLLRLLESTPPCQMTHRWGGPTGMRPRVDGRSTRTK